MNNKTQQRDSLWWIGFWATVWWGVSFVYILLLVWLSRNKYVTLSAADGSRVGGWTGWSQAITQEYHAEKLLQVLVIIIVAVWAIGAYIWLSELKRNKLSYKAAFKDLFLTVRR